uniref:Discoidin, CUB and LCCL domain-containing protein 2 n=1 Tax=Phallusia mammillata TaxID=59560 RepID=A0A6F9DBB9_9ASCI|nr:discoidin, CUB and LCCL domain-containing protein 2 [Phallusia mammillata]
MKRHTRRKYWIVLFYFTTICLKESYAAVSSCNAVLEASSGTFTSPNYPEPPPTPSKSRINSSTFPDNGGYITCKWELRVPAGKAIQLKFADFNMDANLDECDKGEVEVFSGMGKFKQSIDKYCPGNNPDTVILPNNTGTVLFRRPSSFTGNGFLISFIAITPGLPIHDFVTCSAKGEDRPSSQTFNVVCPSGCVGIPSHLIYGDDMYRDDSHLCLAAVHAGVISDSFGGRVQVKKGSHKVLFHMMIANNVTASIGGYWDVTFYFPVAKDCAKEIEYDPRRVTASSYWNETRTKTLWSPNKAVFRSQGGWSPSNPMTNEWLQVDLEKNWNITAIATKGSSLPHKWATAYRIKYSYNGITFSYYKEEGQTTPKLFVGNMDHFTEVRNNFVRPRINARYIRIYPVPVGDIKYRYALKIQINGCPLKDFVTPDPVIPPDPTTIPTPTTTTSTTTLKKTPKTPANPSTTQVVSATTTLAPLNKTTQPDKLNNSGVIIPISKSPTAKTPGQKNPVVPLNERSIIIIAIVAALAVTSILLAALVLILVRKRKKEPKIETIVPKLPISQSNATYHAGIETVRLPSYKKDDKKNSRKGKKNSQKFLFKNDNYTDSYPIVNAQDHVTVQNSRGGVTLQRQLTNNSDIIAPPMRGSYTASDVAGPSTALMTPGGRVCSNHDDTDSFQSDDDHEYQVIPDHVNDFVAARTSSKASTASSHHSKKSDTMLWQQQQQQQGAMWGNAGDSWGKDPNPVFPPPHMTSFSQQSQRSRSGTFPHPVVGELPMSPGPPKTAPPQTSFTAPNFSHRKQRGGSQSPPQPSFVSSNQRHSSSSGGSSHSHFDMTSSKRQEPTEAPYYSSVPQYESQTSAPPNGHLTNTPAMVAPLSEQRRAPSYKTPRQPMFATLPSNGTDGDVRHGGSDPVMTRHNGMENGLARSTSRSDSFAKQRSGYDQLYPQKYPSPPEGAKCMVAMTMNNYDQLNLHTPV